MRQPGRSSSVPIVLIHGAWHGGWCWRKVAPLLRGSGHEVLTPSLTGLGDRVHLLRPEIDLETHITDIANLLEYEALTGAIVVGHSYGGMVLAGLTDRIPERIGHAVYLDAFLPEDGETVNGYFPHYQFPALAAERGDGWRIPPRRFAADYAITDPDDAAWLDARLGDQPLATFTQPIALNGAGDEVPGSYILTSQGIFEPYRERARARGYRCFEIPRAEHDAMITRPRELAGILLELDSSSG